MTNLYCNQVTSSHFSHRIEHEIVSDSDSWNSAQTEQNEAKEAFKKTKCEPLRCDDIQGNSQCGAVIESEGVTETAIVIKREPITDSDSAPTIQPVDDPAVIKTDTAVSLDSWSPREGQERLPSPPQPAHRQVGQTWEVPSSLNWYRLVGLVVRCPPRERKVPGSNPACDGIFSGSSHTSDLNICTPVATLPGAWRYRVSAGTGRPGVSIL